MDECCGQGRGETCRCHADSASVAEAVRSFVRRRIPHPQDAEDVAQETLLRLYRSVDELRDVSAFDGWMYRIARNAIADHHRTGARRPTPVDLADTELAEDVEEESAAAQLTGCLRVLLERVPEGYRRALELTDLGELTQEEAADRLGLTTSGMKSRVQRGRRLLRAEITRCCQVSLDARGGIADVAVRSDDRACLPLVGE
jgi:RNA polymerase sigma-70 factor (ECF subfamily)